MALNDTFLQELKLKTDIEDIISTYVTLKKRGSTSVGLCPFHNEKTPSFTVYPETQSFYCFGCGAGGDAIGFIKRIENLDYIDAVKALAQRAGMQMPEDGYDDSLGKKRRRILEINREAARFFHSYMMSDRGKKGLDYFLSRGLSMKTITRFGLGYAPDAWDALRKHLAAKGYSVGDMLDAGVLRRTQKGNVIDLFRNRVMTPIIDIRGNVIAFGGRVLDDSKPKYINTNETLVYKKTNELFAMNIAKDHGADTLILCEGYMDVIAMHQAGFINAVAGCGTALTEEQVRLIHRYTNEVILCYDNDDAGREATNKAIRLFKKTDIKIRIPALKGGKDPDEIIKNLGKERFAEMLNTSSNEIEYKILELRQQFNLKATQGKVDFLTEVIKLLADASPIEQDIYLSRLAEELQVEKNSLKTQLESQVKRNRSNRRRRALKNEAAAGMNELTRRSYDESASPKKIKAQDRLIALLMRYPQCASLCSDFDASRLSNAFMQKVFKLTMSLIEQGRDTDLINYSGELSDSELGRLSGIVARFHDSDDYKREFRDCLAVINEEYDGLQSVDVTAATGEDYNALFQQLAQSKNKNNNA